MIPLAIATDGYLHGVLSISTRGYISTETSTGIIDQTLGNIISAMAGTFGIMGGENLRYEICSISGFKTFPGELVTDPYTGERVLPRYADTPQREPRAFRSASGKGPKRAEQDDNFITTSVLPEDF